MKAEEKPAVKTETAPKKEAASKETTAKKETAKKSSNQEKGDYYYSTYTVSWKRCSSKG